MPRSAASLKRKREKSPEESTKTRSKRVKGSTSSTSTPHAALRWLSYVADETEITRECSLAFLGVGTLGDKTPCANKFATVHLEALDANGPDIIVLSSDKDNGLQEVTPCTRSRCKSNPYCLNYLGQEKWENARNVKKEVGELIQRRFKGDPRRFRRAEGKPVGLHNLGATCYANAFLQVWNQHLLFRSGVFQCIPSLKEGEILDQSPIFQLQVTFASLSYGISKVFNPRSLVDSLRLNSAEQQDAQEFSKLFLSHLATEFGKQSSPSLRNLITNQFEGKLIYGTHCHGCGYRSERETGFLELEISLKNQSSLVDCLDEALQPELLSGDNQYRCGLCGMLQDATRYSKLRRLPPVLHFSVQRFIFDLKSLVRKKSKNLIRYPMEIDMNRWLSSSSPRASQSVDLSLNDFPNSISRSENIYEIRGILLHKGASAYHGHYESQVFDVQENKWFQFNDDVVTELKSLSPEGVSTSLKSKVLSSKDCYCLIYARKNEKTVEIAQPSAQVMAFVREENTNLLERCEEYERELEDAFQHIQRIREDKAALYRNWHVKKNEGPFKLVPRVALEAFVEGRWPTIENDRTKVEDQKSAEMVQADCFLGLKEILCEHGRINPESRELTKVIKPDAFEHILRDQDGLLSKEERHQEVCKTCIRTISEENSYIEDHCVLVAEFEAALEGREQIDEDRDQAVWISKSWLKDWRCQKPKMHRPGHPDPAPDHEKWKNDVHCSHGNLNPKESSRLLIPSLAAAVITSSFPDWVALANGEEPCAVCEAERYNRKAESKYALKDADTEKMKLKSLFISNPLTNEKRPTSAGNALIPSAWIRAWRMWINSPRLFFRPSWPDNGIFVCSHGLLRFDPSKPQDLADHELCLVKGDDWEEIVRLYPGAGPRIGLSLDIETGKILCTSEVCDECCALAKTNFQMTGLAIQVLRYGCPTPTKESWNAAKAVIAREGLTGSSKDGTRRSRRIKDHNGVSQLFFVPVTLERTVKDIKLEIEKKEKIPAFYQMLYYNGIKLTDLSATVKDLKMEANDLIQFQPLVDLNADMDLDEALDVDDGGIRELERTEGKAFEGTLLATK